MTITNEILEDIKTYGYRNYPASYMINLLATNNEDRKFLQNEFADPSSIFWEYWKQGNVEHENQVDEFLEQFLEKPGEGADDVAKALHFRRKNRDLDEMKNELFGV